jgi:hypothetical protein
VAGGAAARTPRGGARGGRSGAAARRPNRGRAARRSSSALRSCSRRERCGSRSSIRSAKARAASARRARRAARCAGCRGAAVRSGWARSDRRGELIGGACHAQNAGAPLQSLAMRGGARGQRNATGRAWRSLIRTRCRRTSIVCFGRLGRSAARALTPRISFRRPLRASSPPRASCVARTSSPTCSRRCATRSSATAAAPRGGRR